MGCMTDGYNNMTAYGHDDLVDEPEMGWAQYAHSVWVYSSAFFYIRPTVYSIELLNHVAKRLLQNPHSWDQAIFNAELFFPSHRIWVMLGFLLLREPWICICS